jgi:hypothetical protein
MIKFNKAYFKIWKVEDKGKYKALQCTTGDKQQDGTYKNSSWNVRLVGKANVEVSEGDMIEVISGKIENIYDKENKKAWLNVIAFELESRHSKGKLTDDSDLPF